MLDRQSGPATLGEPLAVATSLIDPFCPGGRGAVSSRRSLFKYLNRPQANTSALPLLTPVYSPEGQVPQRTMHKLLYEPSQVYYEIHALTIYFRDWCLQHIWLRSGDVCERKKGNCDSCPDVMYSQKNRRRFLYQFSTMLFIVTCDMSSAQWHVGGQLVYTRL